MEVIEKLYNGSRESSNEQKFFTTKTETQIFAENKRLQEKETNGTFPDSSSDDSCWSTDGMTWIGN